jgi:predicted ATP-grasp superfamily ATP-dependent carboligase
VTATDDDRVSVGFFSRYCRRAVVTPDPARHPAAFADAVLDELAREPYDVVLPVIDHALFALARRRTEVERHSRFPFMGHEALLRAHDKALSVELARRCGLRVPETFAVENADDVETALSRLTLPVVVRPRNTHGSLGLRTAARAEEVWPVCRRLAHDFGPVIIQEYIPWGGFTYDVDVLMNGDSTPAAAVVCRRIRTYPPLAGPTSCGQAVHWPGLVDVALSVLREIHWYGPAEVEFRIDPRDGSPVFMEVNPRLWGSLFTSIVAGVDFPYLLYRLAMEGSVPPVTEYRTDMKARYFFTLDMLCLASHPRKRTIARQWLADFFDPRTRELLLSRRDPLPLFGKLLASIVYGLRPSRLRERLGREG